MSRADGPSIGTIQFFDSSRFVDVQQRRISFVNGDEFVLDHFEM